MSLTNHRDDQPNSTVYPLRSEKTDHFPVRNLQMKSWSSILLGIMLILACILYLLYTTYTIWLLIEIHGRAIILNRLPMPLVTIFIIFLTSMIIIFSRVFHWKDGVTIDQHGLVLKIGTRKRVLRWQEINRLDTRLTNVKFGSTVIATRKKIILSSANNQTIVLRNHYERMDDLIHTIRQKCLPILIHKAKYQINAGETIAFHKDLKADAKGLVIKNQPLPWKVLQEPVIKSKNIKLFHVDDSKHPLANIKLNKINNLDLLLFLLQGPPVFQGQSSPK